MAGIYGAPARLMIHVAVQQSTSVAGEVLEAAAVPGADRALMRRLLDLPRFALGEWPTPLAAVEWQGRELLVKRDDASGWQRGGAKTRKIENLLGWMIQSGHDSLVTFAGNVTNLAFDLVPAAERAGIRLVLLIVDDPRLPLPARNAIFAELSDSVRLIGPSRLNAAVLAARALSAERRAGRRPLLVLPGGSHPAAIAGNAVGFLEMASQLLSAGAPLPDEVVVASATGNTAAGFHIGAHALAAAGIGSVRVSAAQVYPGRIEAFGRFLWRWTYRWLDVGSAADSPAPSLWPGALQGGFARYDADLVELTDRVLDATAVRLDPIFGAKAWRLLEHRCASRPTDRLLYWHCGFTPEWATLGRHVRAAELPQ